MFYIFLADGFEEIECIETVDILRRASIDIKTVSITQNLLVTGAHDITIKTDIAIEDLDKSTITGIILPGGVPGVNNLANSGLLKETVLYAHQHDILICAICAAPFVLDTFGAIDGMDITIYPSYEGKIQTAKVLSKNVVVDKNVITAKGAGVTNLFAFEIVKKIKGVAVADNLKMVMQYE